MYFSVYLRLFYALPNVVRGALVRHPCSVRSQVLSVYHERMVRIADAYDAEEGGSGTGFEVTEDRLARVFPNEYAQHVHLTQVDG